ncbi:hypothetical protein P8452_19180 [Trifolium repens]|nr:hypothetical protein P8452_19180 [Trifolium repens]
MIEPYNKLVKLAARAFYDDLTSEGDNQPKKGRSDNRGIAVVVLDALTRRQWVREEDLARDLKLHTKQLRRTLHLFEKEKIITQDHRRETAKGAKIYSAAVASTTGKEGEEKVKLHTHSYCCLDYAQIYDVVRYRLHHMKHKLKDELENKNTIREYLCTNCGNRYNSLDVLGLLSSEDGDFLCERCNGTLVESDQLAAQEGGDGDGDENARRRRREKLKDMLQKMEVQLKPLIDQLGRVKDLPIPEFGSLQAWEARASAAGRAANGDNAGDSKSHLGYNGAPMPYSGDTKVLPPWMITSGMNLTKEQRGEVKQETKMDGASTYTAAQYTDEKISTIGNDDKNIQDEYIKAYYAALLKKQHELEEAAKTQDANAADDPSSSTSIREVGRKSKREEDDDGTKWEEAPVRGNGIGAYKVDLNVEADAPAEDDENDIDWEEG